MPNFVPFHYIINLKLSTDTLFCGVIAMDQQTAIDFSHDQHIHKLEMLDEQEEKILYA